MKRLTFGVLNASIILEAMNLHRWDSPELLPEERTRPAGYRPTGAEKTKRAAKKRRNIQARSRK
jgi:hypothetical protein